MNREQEIKLECLRLAVDLQKQIRDCNAVKLATDFYEFLKKKDAR